MSSSMEAPFSDQEKRFVLAEAIKTSSVPVDRLLHFVNENDVQPLWTEIFLPFGRNLNSCRNAWDALRAGPATSSLPSAPAPERKRKSDGLEPLQAAPQPKRRPPGADTMIRIQPKPSNGSPLAFSSSTATQPKKRGRPSKADVEARNAALIARGEVLPPPRTLLARDSVGGDANSDSATVHGGYGGLAAVAPMMAPGLPFEPRMSTSYQSGPSGSESSEMMNQNRDRPGSRSSHEPRQGESSFRSYAQSPSRIELPRPPSTNPPPVLSERPPILPPRPEGGGFGAPVYPAIDALLSPEPPRPPRSGP